MASEDYFHLPFKKSFYQVPGILWSLFRRILFQVVASCRKDILKRVKGVPERLAKRSQHLHSILQWDPGYLYDGNLWPILVTTLLCPRCAGTNYNQPH